jgi:hypothetical protein
MDGGYSDSGVRLSPDRWRRGRYRAELSAYVEDDLEGMDAAVRGLGYEPIDADQWGRSYRHRDDPARKVELDETEDGAGVVRVVLSHEGIERPEAREAADRLREEYEALAAGVSAQRRVEAAEANGYLAFAGWPGGHRRRAWPIDGNE